VNKQISARRTLEELIEQMVIRWVEAVQTPPATLAKLVSRYRDLQFYNSVEEDPAPTDWLMDVIFDRLKERAMAREKIISAVPLRAQMDRAIADWRQGVRA
jgi:hypothetical protein